MGNLTENKDKLNIVITCGSGIEKALKSELFRLGYGDVPAVEGALEVRGDYIDVAKLNISLRTADRVYIKLGEFTATTFDELFDGVSSINFEDFIDKNGVVLVDGKCVKSTIFAISASQKIVKKAIVERMKKIYKYSNMPENGSEYKIFFKIVKDKAEILLNTSGTGLHKRGYRKLVGIAPIKETLASAMLLYSDFYYKNPFCDPFCGSGTFLIESAFIGLNIAPNKNRTFDFNLWKTFDSKYYNLALEEAIANEKLDRKLEIFGFDIDKKAISLAEEHAKNAGVYDYIKFKRQDVKNLSIDIPNGTIVTNPPYGERVYNIKEAERAYKDFGEAIKKMPTWSKFVITPVKNFEKCFGEKADRKRKLYNSDKECNLYYFYADKKGKNNEND